MYAQEEVNPFMLWDWLHALEESKSAVSGQHAWRTSSPACLHVRMRSRMRLPACLHHAPACLPR